MMWCVCVCVLCVCVLYCANVGLLQPLLLPSCQPASSWQLVNFIQKVLHSQLWYVHVYLLLRLRMPAAVLLQHQFPHQLQWVYLAVQWWVSRWMGHYFTREVKGQQQQQQQQQQCLWELVIKMTLVWVTLFVPLSLNKWWSVRNKIYGQTCVGHVCVYTLVYVCISMCECVCMYVCMYMCMCVFSQCCSCCTVSVWCLLPSSLLSSSLQSKLQVIRLKGLFKKNPKVFWKIHVQM